MSSQVVKHNTDHFPCQITQLQTPDVANSLGMHKSWTGSLGRVYANTASKVRIPNLAMEYLQNFKVTPLDKSIPWCYN